MIEINTFQKPIWQTIEELGNKKICHLKNPNSSIKDLSLKTSTISSPNKYSSKIKDYTNKTLGHDIYGIYPEDDKIVDFSMQIEPEYRNEGLYLGELLRLKSIIELLENGLSHIELTSKETAIFFHSKYKFQPKITSFTQRDFTLSSIIQNAQKGYEEFANEAKKLVEKIKQNTCGKLQREYCKDTNKLADKYIQQVLSTQKQEYKKHPFRFPINMILTEEQIRNNKEFFNKLFSKHGIDYKIKE